MALRQSTTFKQAKWYGNVLGIRTPTGYLHLTHDKEKNILLFHANSGGNKSFENLKELINVLSSNDHRIYLEWCQQATGSYVYFDLSAIVQKLQTFTSFEVNLLTNINNTDNKDNEDKIIDKTCYFDESVTIESRLRVTDVLILSPLRSILSRYTPMGIYRGHQLYLGPVPSVEFMNQFKVTFIFNCCQRQNAKELTAKTKAKERLFNVSKWKWTKQYVYKPFEYQHNEKNKAQENENKNDENEENKNNDDGLKMTRLQYLDAMIDEIDFHLKKGNIIIHCLAGAHRSPFITGCYLHKYGLKDTKSKSAEDIYKHLKLKRAIVQELGYDKKLTEYQQYLKKKSISSHTKSD